VPFSIDSERAQTSEATRESGSDLFSSTPTTAPPTALDTVFDPFTGVSIGVLASPSGQSDTPVAKEELWAHLARLRTLQADIASLHVTMEGIGVGEPLATRGERVRKRSMIGTRLEEDTADSEGDEAAEERRRKEREREFELSERQFETRKEEIGRIMGKVSLPR